MLVTKFCAEYREIQNHTPQNHIPFLFRPKTVLRDEIFSSISDHHFLQYPRRDFRLKSPLSFN